MVIMARRIQVRLKLAACCCESQLETRASLSKILHKHMILWLICVPVVKGGGQERIMLGWE